MSDNERGLRIEVASHPPATGSPQVHQSSARLENLSARELDVLRLIVTGRTDRQISAALVVALPTVKTHVRHILQKLQVRSRHQAADAAKNHPLDDCDFSTSR